MSILSPYSLHIYLNIVLSPLLIEQLSTQFTPIFRSKLITQAYRDWVWVQAVNYPEFQDGKGVFQSVFKVVSECSVPWAAGLRGSMYNPCPKVLVNARFEPIERPHINTVISPNLLNNSITTSRPGLKLKTEIQQIMENQK